MQICFVCFKIKVLYIQFKGPPGNQIIAVTQTRTASYKSRFDR